MIEVPRGGTAWGQTKIKNKGQVAFFFSIQKQRQQLQNDQVQTMSFRPLVQQQFNDAHTGEMLSSLAHINHLAIWTI